MERIEKQIVKNIKNILKAKPVVGNPFVAQSEQAKAVSDWLYALINIQQYNEIKKKNDYPVVMPYYTNGYLHVDEDSYKPYPVVTVSSNGANTVGGVSLPGNVSVSGNLSVGGEITAHASNDDEPLIMRQ